MIGAGGALLLEAPGLLACDKVVAPGAAEGHEGLQVCRAVLLAVHAEGKLAREGFGTPDAAQVRTEERVVQNALGNEGEAHAVDDRH